MLRRFGVQLLGFVQCEGSAPTTNGINAEKAASAARVTTTRASRLERLQTEHFDVLVIGGGATGAGVALDAALRGLRVALVDRDDFAAATSSRSTKLIHGGVRYLEKAFKEFDFSQYALVKEALMERETLLTIAPHLTQPVAIMLPIYRWWQVPYFWAGLKAYELIARFHQRSFFSADVQGSFFLTARHAAREIPVLNTKGLCGAMVYYDGQFDDAAMSLAVALTAEDCGAALANHVEVRSLLKEDSRVVGASVQDRLTGNAFDIKAKVVVNATGPFADSIRSLDNKNCATIIEPSAGVHLVLPNYFLGSTGLLVPHTSDDRVVFLLPWEGRVLLGTTDTPSPALANPAVDDKSIDFMLAELRKQLDPSITVSRKDVLSAWSGIRPLVKSNTSSTQSIVRSHFVTVSDSGMVTVTGGKWTTYRKMAEDTVTIAAQAAGLPVPPCSTALKPVRGADNFQRHLFIDLIRQYRLDEDVAKYLAHRYGDQAAAVAAAATLNGQTPAVRLHPAFPYLEAQVAFAATHEHAGTAVDVLARRTRLAFIDSRAARACVPRVVTLLAKELGWSKERVEAEARAAESFVDAMTVEA